MRVRVMSPVQKVKEVGDTASPWAVIGMVAYLIIFNDPAGSTPDYKEIAKAFAESSSSQVQTNIAVMTDQFKRQTTDIAGIKSDMKGMSEKLEPMARDIQSLQFRLTAVEQYIADKRQEQKE